MVHWLLILLAVSWPISGKEAPAYWDALSVAGMGKDYGSNIEPADNTTVTNFNKTHFELRDITAIDWPGPFPAFFQFPSTERLNHAYVGYAEIFVLVRAALLGICQRNRAFQRYFQESEAENVRKVFEKVLGDGYGPAEVADPTWPFSVGYSDRLSAGFDENPCDDVPGLAAVLTNTRADGPGSVLFLCPFVFADVPEKLTEIDCNDIGASAGPEMMTLGSIMLHEILHWNVITYKAARLFIVDYGYGTVGKKVSNDGSPPDGYGAYNAWVLNGQANGADKQPSLNSDNYQWFALESYWSFRCEREFNDPKSDTPVTFSDQITNMNQPANPPP